MPDTAHLLVFIAAGLLLNLTPGPDVLYIVNSSLKGGARAGMVAALAIVCGCFVHVFAAAFGVGALLASSTAAFSLLKWAGGAYLVWMGLRLLIARETPPKIAATAAAVAPLGTDLPTVFRRGFLTNVLNPKVALFFLAFVPQFIPHDTPNKVVVFLALGLLFNINSLPINLGYAWLAAKAAQHMRSAQHAMRWMDRAAGLMFVGFGLKLVMSDNSSA